MRPAPAPFRGAKAAEKVRRSWLRRVVEAERAVAAGVRAVLAADRDRLRGHGTAAGLLAAIEATDGSALTAALRSVVAARLTAAAEAVADDEWGRVAGRKAGLAAAKGRPRPKLPPPPGMREGVRTYVRVMVEQDHWDDFSKTRLRRLASVVRRGVLEEWKPDQVTRAVDAALNLSDGVQAERIARTETTGALNAGLHAAMKHLAEAKLIKGKVWVAGPGARPAHAAADMQRRKWDKRFRVGGEWAMFPGDPALSAGNRVNCRCRVISVPADEGD